MVSAPFSGITVLERAGFIAGPYCAKLLGDLGARVVKIEQILRDHKFDAA